jgi:hypothetical protein
MSFLSYGLFETPVLTNHGMIAGMTSDGTYKFVPNPVINVNDFFTPRYNSCNERRTMPIDDYIRQEQEKNQRNAPIKKIDSKSDAEILREKLQSELECERKKNEELLKKLEKEKNDKISEEKEKTKLTSEKLDEFNRLMHSIALKKLKSSRSERSSVSSYTSPSSVASTKKSSKTSKSSRSSTSSRSTASIVSSFAYPESVISSENESVIDFDDASSHTSDETITEEEINHLTLNSQSRYATCTGCDECFNGVSSTGTVFVNETDKDVSFLFGFNIKEKSYSDFGQKLKNDGYKTEFPVERAEKALKRLTKVECELIGNEYIDIVLRDRNHVHRVYMIKSNKDISEFKNTVEITDYKWFNLSNMNDNFEQFEKYNAYDTTGTIRLISKRAKKFIDAYYNKFQLV